MGFPSVCYCVILPRPLLIALHIFEHIKLVISITLFYVGLNPWYEDFIYTPFQPNDISTQLHGLSSSPEAIKSTLPVVKFSSFVKSCGTSATREDHDEAICAVCLVSLEDRHEVRELGNCSHVFHKGCIDKWVDIGQLNCPLCRAKLLPERREERWLM